MLYIAGFLANHFGRYTARLSICRGTEKFEKMVNELAQPSGVISRLLRLWAIIRAIIWATIWDTV